MDRRDPISDERLEVVRTGEPWGEPMASNRPTEPGPPPLLCTDGPPMVASSHEPWPVFSLGELVDVNGFVYRVGHVGPAHLLLEPAAPFLVGGSEAAPFASDGHHRLVELWNALSYASTTLSQLIGTKEGLETAREVLRVARLVQRGGPAGNQPAPHARECLSLGQLSRQAQLRLADCWDEVEAAVEAAVEAEAKK